MLKWPLTKSEASLAPSTACCLMPSCACSYPAQGSALSCQDSSNTNLSDAIILGAHLPFSIILPLLLERESLPRVPFPSPIALCFPEPGKIPSFPPSLKEPGRTAWKVISNYSIAHSEQWKHQQFIRQRGLDQMDHQLLSFSMSGSSFQPNYLMLAFSLYLTNKSIHSMDNGLHPAKNQGYM